MKSICFIRRKIINITALLSVTLLAAMHAKAHSLIFEQGQYNAGQFEHVHQQCSALLSLIE